MKPIIEQRLEDTNHIVATRKRVAEIICHFLVKAPNNSQASLPKTELFYEACASLLGNRESQRILFYLPFAILEAAPESFRVSYLDAWFRLLNTEDVRENFHIGDCYELDARPECGLERVIKCAHLTPWLLKFGYLNTSCVLDILCANRDNETLLQSFKDTWNYIGENQIVNTMELHALVSATAHLPIREERNPLYISRKRREWLAERGKPVELRTPLAKLEGPFSDNIPQLESQLEQLKTQIAPSEVLLIGGSQLKGYGTTKSDLDIWKMAELESSNVDYPGSPHAAHIYFNTIWLFGDVAAREAYDMVSRISEAYTSRNVQPEIRRQSLERLEFDLLLYRLLHKGFSRFTGRNNFTIPVEMDGDCSFYDDEYRRIATMLYVKYVWL